MDRLAFDRRVKALTKDLPPLPDFSRFHDRFRADPMAVRHAEGDMREAFFLAYDEDNCEYLPLVGRGAGDRRMERAANSSRPPSSFPIRRAFRYWCRARCVTARCSTFMRKLDVKEIHGYVQELGLRVFKARALKVAKHGVRIAAAE